MHDICKGGVSIQLTLRGLLGLCGGMSSTECHSLTHSLRLFRIYVSDVTDLGRKRGKEESNKRDWDAAASWYCMRLIHQVMRLRPILLA